MAENLATWGEAERVISRALAKAAHADEEETIYGLSEERIIADALREAGLLKDGA